MLVGHLPHLEGLVTALVGAPPHTAPARLVTGLVTERGIIAPNREALAGAFAERAAAAISGIGKP